MARIDGAQKCKRLWPSDLTDHQAIRSHTKARPQQFVDSNSRLAKFASDRHQPQRIRVREHDFGRVLDHDQTAVLRYFLQQRVQECRFPCARTAGDNDVAPRLYRSRKKPEQVSSFKELVEFSVHRSSLAARHPAHLREGACFLVVSKAQIREHVFAYRQREMLARRGRRYDLDTRSIRKRCGQQRMLPAQTLTGVRSDLLGETLEHHVVDVGGFNTLESRGAVDPDFSRLIDEDIGHVGPIEPWRQRRQIRSEIDPLADQLGGLSSSTGPTVEKSRSWLTNTRTGAP